MKKEIEQKISELNIFDIDTSFMNYRNIIEILNNFKIISEKNDQLIKKLVEALEQDISFREYYIKFVFDSERKLKQEIIDNNKQLLAEAKEIIE